MARHAPKDNRKVALARRLRKSLTEPEQLLWQRLKVRPEPGLKFRRQHPFGPYILDFYCTKASLCVEVDGHQHSEDKAVLHDEVRDRWLEAQQIEVYRIPATEVYRSPEDVADGIVLKALGRMEGVSK